MKYRSVISNALDIGSLLMTRYLADSLRNFNCSR